MNIWAIVPIKPLNRAKSRLAGVLDAKDREALSREMLEQTLDTLQRVEGIGGILAISRDTSVLSIARRYEAQTVQESGAPELNDALMRATKVVSTWHASGVLVVASDIPLMCVKNIEELLELAKYPPAVVIAPDRHQDGTNALLIRPPGLIPYCFGESSFRKHVTEAEAVGVEVYVYESPTLGLDIDTPADLDLYREVLAERRLDGTVCQSSP